jgi:hypothetical protein
MKSRKQDFRFVLCGDGDNDGGDHGNVMMVVMMVVV